MEDYRYVMKVVENAILSTDLAMYFKKNKKFMELIENGEFDWQSEEKKECEYVTVTVLFPCKLQVIWGRWLKWKLCFKWPSVLDVKTGTTTNSNQKK